VLIEKPLENLGKSDLIELISQFSDLMCERHYIKSTTSQYTKVPTSYICNNGCEL